MPRFSNAFLRHPEFYSIVTCFAGIATITAALGASSFDAWQVLSCASVGALGVQASLCWLARRRRRALRRANLVKAQASLHDIVERHRILTRLASQQNAAPNPALGEASEKLSRAVTAVSDALQAVSDETDEE